MRGDPRPRRVAFYSHDTVGLGHTRRNLALAAALVGAEPATDVLLLTGNPEAAALPRPPHTDVVTLPTIGKGSDGEYRSRVLRSPLAAVLDLRSRVLEAALTAFAPDLLVVDKVPLGVGDELAPALSRLVRSGRTRLVLGLRDVLDEPVAAVRDWQSMQTTAALRRFYDEVWVYGDRAVYDPVTEYGLPPEVADKVVYTGYLGHGRGQRGAPADDGTPASEPYVLCLVGGGEDGFALADAFVRSAMPAGHRGVVLTGPFLPPPARARLDRTAAVRGSVTVSGFVPDPESFLTGAAAVVSMAGYNSACEILATPTPALLVPRSRPRAEQLVRAERLCDLGLVDLVQAERLDAEVVQDWLGRAVGDRRQAQARRDSSIDLDGLRTVPALADALVRGGRRAA